MGPLYVVCKVLVILIWKRALVKFEYWASNHLQKYHWDLNKFRNFVKGVHKNNAVLHVKKMYTFCFFFIKNKFGIQND